MRITSKKKPVTLMVLMILCPSCHVITVIGVTDISASKQIFMRCVCPFRIEFMALLSSTYIVKK